MALTEESVAEMIKKHITAACQEGGELFTMIAGVKAGRGGDRKDEGIVGMLKKQGNQLQPSRFENEVKSGILFRHWNDEMRSFLKLVDENMLVLLNIAEKNPDTKSNEATTVEYLSAQMTSMAKDKAFINYLKKCDGNMDGMYDEIKNFKDEELHTLLLFSMGGEAKEMVRNAAPSGIEAWRALTSAGIGRRSLAQRKLLR